MRGDSLKERILRVATIEEVVAAYVPLQRSGAGYVGLCPFHADKHPSLHVHPGKQFFKCFACGEGCGRAKARKHGECHKDCKQS